MSALKTVPSALNGTAVNPLYQTQVPINGANYHTPLPNKFQPNANPLFNHTYQTTRDANGAFENTHKKVNPLLAQTLNKL